MRYLQSRDKLAGREELLKEQEKQADEEIKDANIIRNSELDDDFLLEPAKRKSKLSVVSADILEFQGRGDPNSQAGNNED